MRDSEGSAARGTKLRWPRVHLCRQRLVQAPRPRRDQVRDRSAAVPRRRCRRRGGRVHVLQAEHRQDHHRYRAV